MNESFSVSLFLAFLVQSSRCQLQNYFPKNRFEEFYNMADNKARVTLEQREIMLNFMKEHSQFAAGRFATADGMKCKARLLEKMSEELNCVGGGCTKTGDKWFKCWQDWKCDVKKKASKIRRHANGTGGGPPIKVKLTQLEEDLIHFMGPVAVTGSPVTDPLDAQFVLAEIPTDTMRLCSNEILSVESVPCGQWIDAVVDQLGSKPLEPSSTLNENNEPVPAAVNLRSPAPTESSSNSSSSSAKARRSRKSSQRSERNSESSICDQIVYAAQMSADNSAREATLRERSLAFKEELLKFQRDDSERRYELAREELEIKARKVQAVEKQASALVSMAEALHKIKSSLLKDNP